ncbi:TPA: glycosyltransferase family 2 protein [Campylobacter coli]|nr:glycosyltransferase family 2 protein [Campylobacter coli]MBX1227799.1 glycosyltransferase family 2 protein [Campylobacter coli]MBX2588651.1 glycosyltransferase family 2 protein [Campylobacter coli]HEC1871811.1 glycosyltransferase family 2 protein [Campylobacter coli]
MSKNKPLVSVVMPTFNGSTSGYIKESIESVLRQTYKNFEFIIVNDCSIDDTLNIIQDYASQDDRIRIVNNQTNQKLPQSLNNGFNLANGIYYTWTSDDNYYHENALEEMVKYLEKNPNKILVCSDYEILGLKSYSRIFKVSAAKEDLISYDSVGACFMYRADAAKQIGDFGVIHQILYTYRFQPNSLSMTAKKGEIDNKTNELLYKFLPRYIEKYPNLNLDVISRMRMALVSGLNLKDEVKKIWKTSDRRTKRMIYVFLRDRFANSGKNIYKESIKVLSVKYIIKFYIFCIKHRIKF